MFVRNSGRASLLDRTLAEDKAAAAATLAEGGKQGEGDLASLVRSLTWRADTFQDKGHPEVALSILRKCPNVATVNLGDLLFRHGSSSMALSEHLCQVMPKQASAAPRSLGFGYIPCLPTHAVPLLLAWSGSLRELSLHRVRSAQGTADEPLLRLATPPGPPHPSYTLSSLSLVDTELQTPELEWLLGHTAAARSLETLSLDNCAIIGRDEVLLHVLSQVVPTVHTLSIGFAPSDDPPRHYVGVADELVRHAHKLEHLIVSDTTPRQLLASPQLFRNLASADRLRTLELRGRHLFVTVDVVSAIIRGRLPALEHLILRGPFHTDAAVFPCRRVCAHRGIRLDVRRLFK